MTDRLIAYYRVSTDTQIKNDTIDNQKVACEKFALKHGATIIESFAEPQGASGSKDDRPEYLKAKNRLSMPDVDGLIVFDMDRWSRSKRTSTIDMLDLEELHKKVYMARTEEITDWTREGDDLIMQVKAWVAAKEREKIRSRLKQGRDKVKAGLSTKRPGKGWNSWKSRDFTREEWEKIDRYLKIGVPKTMIADHLEVSRRTLYNKLKARK